MFTSRAIINFVSYVYNTFLWLEKKCLAKFAHKPHKENVIINCLTESCNVLRCKSTLKAETDFVKVKKYSFDTFYLSFRSLM